eukprot:gene18718-25242_t
MSMSSTTTFQLSQLRHAAPPDANFSGVLDPQNIPHAALLLPPDANSGMHAANHLIAKLGGRGLTHMTSLIERHALQPDANSGVYGLTHMTSRMQAAANAKTGVMQKLSNAATPDANSVAVALGPTDIPMQACCYT